MRIMLSLLCILALFFTLSSFPNEKRELITNVSLSLAGMLTMFSLLVFGMMRTLLNATGNANHSRLTAPLQILTCTLIIGISAVAALLCIGPIAPKNMAPIVLGTIYWCASVPSLAAAAFFKRDLRYLYRSCPFLILALASSCFLLFLSKSLALSATAYVIWGAIATSLLIRKDTPEKADARCT